MRRTLGLVAGFLAASLPAARAVGDEPACHRGPTVEAVTARRESFNQAIRNADLGRVEDVLADDAVLVAGTHSDLFVHRAAQLGVWRQEFDSGPDRRIYVRTPSCIRLSSIGPMASERGRWRGEDSSGGYASGTYSAKWRRIGGEWRLEAEIFMTEDCAGSGCPAGDES